jgi:hypothetical protein
MSSANSGNGLLSRAYRDAISSYVARVAGRKVIAPG